MNMNENPNLANEQSLDEEQNLLAELHKAASYSGEQLRAKTREKQANRRRMKKGQKPKESKDLSNRKSIANELQHKIQKGEAFMANINNGRERNNVIGGVFTSNSKQIDVSDLTLGVKQKNLLHCIKEFYLSEDDVKTLKERYALLVGMVPSYNKDQIPTESEYIRIHNTVAAVVVNYKVHNNWKVTIALKKDDKKKGDSSDEVLVTRNYKEKRDKFPMLDTFGHALNQIGRWTNLDMGISVKPVWCDPTNIGLVEPSDVDSIAQKVVMLHTFAGLNAEYGMACEPGSNPDIMTSSEKEFSVDEESFIGYTQFFKYVNLAELVFASAFTRGPILTEREKKEVSLSRYSELYTCAYDKELFKDRSKAYLLSCLRHDC